VICDDFRARWSDRDPVDGMESFDAVDADFAEHRSTCRACATFAERFDALDNLLGAALVVTPPPELAARLQRLPLTVRAAVAQSSEPDEAHVIGIALEFAALLLIGLGTFALLGNNLLVGWELVLGRVGDVLQELALLVSSPIVPYVQNLAFTGMEALATLLLLVMGFDRVTNGLSQAPLRRDAGE
jgi:hypothetical protein